MITYIFALRSRSQAMRFYDQLRDRGIRSKIINTPREASVGCGISVEVCPSDLPLAREVLTRAYPSLIGIFRCERINYRLTVSRVY